MDTGLNFAKVSVELREQQGKGGAHKVRAAGKVPGVLYGRRQPPVSVAFDSRLLVKALDKDRRRNTVFTLTLSGGGKSEEVTAMIKDAQIDPISQTLVHVDFLRVDMADDVQVTVPLVLVGQGGRRRQRRPAAPEHARAVDCGEAGRHPHEDRGRRLGARHRHGAARQRPEARRRHSRADRRRRSAVASVVAPKAEKVEAEATLAEGAAPAADAAAGGDKAAAGGDKAAAGAAPRAATRPPRPLPRRRRRRSKSGPGVSPKEIATCGWWLASEIRGGNTRTRATTSGSGWSTSSLQRAGSPAWRSKWGADIVETKIGSERVLLCKPMEFMNVSGQPVVRVASFWKVDAPHTVVVHDELDVPFGRLKLGQGGGHGGNNGVRSILAEWGTGDFHRVRVGIGRPRARARRLGVGAEPLRRRRSGEVPAVLERAADAARCIVTDGPQVAMNRFNGKRGRPRSPRKRTKRATGATTRATIPE